MAGKGGAKDASEKTKYLRLNEDLKSGQYSPLYLLYGSENYLKRSYKKQFREAFGGLEGMNVQLFQGAAEAEALIDALETMPFFAEHRLVILEDSGYCKKAAPEKLLAYLPSMPPSSHLMMVEAEADKRGKLYKLVQKSGFACELSEQDLSVLSNWAARYLARAGKKIRSATMQALLQKTGSSMDRIAGELEKLIAYTGEREVVEDRDLEELCSQNAEDRVFDMIAALSLGQADKAMGYYGDLLTLQEPPMKILALMRRHYRQLMLAKEAGMARPGASRQESAKYAGVSPWIFQKLQEQARRFTMEDLEQRLAACLHADTAIKSGNLSDRMAVELLLLR